MPACLADVGCWAGQASAVKRHDAYLDSSSLIGSGKGAEVEFEDAEGMKAAIAQVRDNANAITWVLAGYKDKKTIALIATGTGGALAAGVPAATNGCRRLGLQTCPRCWTAASPARCATACSA
jgi:hypothetical protein